VLRNPHDAEDAFQATFLVLVRKAASVRPRERVGNWLYGVAYRTALEARSILARRHARERQVSAMPEPPAPSSDDSRDWRPLLDEALNRLPEKYRTAVVLCELEGRSRKEVARILGIPEGTLSSRLATARQMLARRLARHGLGISAAAVAAFLGQQTSAAVPAPLLTTTVHAATLFAAGSTAAAAAISTNVVLVTEGVLKAMFLTKLKTVTAVFVLMAVLGGGIGLVGSGTQAGPPDDNKPGQAKPADAKKGGQPIKVELVLNRDVEKKLNATVDINFDNRPLHDVLAELRDSAGLNILVDKLALSNQGVTQDAPITLQLQGVTRKTALKYILRDAGGLTFKIEDGVLVVTAGSLEGDQKMRRVYPVADLVGQSKDAEDLIRVIRNTVGDIRSWAFRKGDPNDGDFNPSGGTIEYFAEGKSLVINQTREVQEQTQELLDELRIAKKQQEQR
jgi:RNA polymerase sigma factor (sigma-70 family)